MRPFAEPLGKDPVDNRRAVAASGGLVAETGEDYRTPWRRDFGRLIHSAAFRRLQGKTQLFYGQDSVFRNRLTHSLEVAQIAKSIALKLQAEEGFSVEPDICEFAGLAHDLGHPPFGHNGERALDDFMKADGGFEGNAQTLRILTRLDKRQKATDALCGIDECGRDQRKGMNLTYRSIASVLKYCEVIPFNRARLSGVSKGYYYDDREVVGAVVEHVLGGAAAAFTGKFKTVECSIMDVADDIAYSTYDLEDAWKAGFLDPLELMAVKGDKLQRIARKVRKDKRLSKKTDGEIASTLANIVRGTLKSVLRTYGEIAEAESDPIDKYLVATGLLRNYVDDLSANSYRRIEFTSRIVDEAIRSVTLTRNEAFPSLSSVALSDAMHFTVVALKHYTYVAVIENPRLTIPEYRGYELVHSLAEGIYEAQLDGVGVLPADFGAVYEAIPVDQVVRRKRVVADFVAGMTDEYAASFYNRMVSDYPTTIFGPSL